MPDNLTVIFLDYFEDLKTVLPAIKKVCAGLKQKPIVVVSNYDTVPLAGCLGLETVYFDELLLGQDYRFMDEYVSGLVSSWYAGLKPVEGRSVYKGIQFGEIAEERAQRFFSAAVKRLEIILKIIERFRPQRIVLIGEKRVFGDLAVFIKERLGVPAVFIKAAEKGNVLSKIINYFRASLSEGASRLCDSFMKGLISGKKPERGIFIDSRLYFELRDLRKTYHPYLYLIENGLRIRLKLIKEDKLPYAPVLTEGIFRPGASFGAAYGYWRIIAKDRKFQEGLSYRNLPIWGILKRAVREMIIDDFSYARENTIFLEKLFRTLRPGLVVLREDARAAERTVALSAKAAGARTLVVQHGILAGRGVHTRLVSDKIALWGRAGIDWFARYGNNGSSRYIVTGKPGHDLVYSKKDGYRKEAAELFLKMGLDPDRETVLYVPGDFKKQRPLFCVYNFHDSEYLALNSVLNTARHFPQKQWIIKMHPFDAARADSLSGYVKDYPNVFVVRNTDIKALIEASVLVIVSFFSSAGLDTVILGKPMITLNLYRSEDLVPFAERGVALNVKEPEELHQTVKRIFEEKESRERLLAHRAAFIEDYAYKIDGKSTERLFSLVKDLYNENSLNQSAM